MARRQGMGFQFAEWRGEVLLLQGGLQAAVLRQSASGCAIGESPAQSGRLAGRAIASLGPIQQQDLA
ncbi:hypothetical protein PSJE_27010 [Pseudomonas jessenii]|nr:hypothetical protein PSJE_27010 [Pseudomonas jessenii]